MLFCLNINFKAQQKAREQAWKSIIILQTTRSEIEKRFGKPKDYSNKNTFGALYEFENYNFRVNYAHGCSNGKQSDYAVRLDTVKELTIYFPFDVGKEVSLSTFNVDKTKFEIGVCSPYLCLMNNNEGVTYFTFENEQVRRIRYYPKKEDFKLICESNLETEVLLINQ